MSKFKRQTTVVACLSRLVYIGLIVIVEAFLLRIGNPLSYYYSPMWGFHERSGEKACSLSFGG